MPRSGTTQTSHYRCRIGREAQPFALPRRTHVWLGLAISILYRQILEETLARWAGNYLHYPSTVFSASPAI
jgi:hypothetical protein